MVILFTTILVSFLGSVHPGPLNVSVVSTALEKGKKGAIYLAIGGIIPEFIYSTIAAEGVMYFLRNLLFFNLLRWAMVIILLYFSATILWNQTARSIKKPEIKAGKLFLKGFILSILNPQLLLFWMLIVLYYQSFNLLKMSTHFDTVMFVLGTGIGAFLLNFVYAQWAVSYKDFIFKNIKMVTLRQITAISFIIMAIFQVYKIFFG